MPTLLIDEHIPFIRGILEPHAKIIYINGGIISHDLAKQADGLIIRTRTICDETLLDRTPVKFIATATIGFDHIDTEYCDRKGITWRHAPGCNSSSVMQYIASVLVTLSEKHNKSLINRKIGIIGVGNVGEKVAFLSSGFGMIPILNDPPRERQEKSTDFVTLDEIAGNCEIITFHVPLNKIGADNTYHIADDRFFSRLAHKPLIINTSRGPVVDTNAVKNALRKKLIAGYVADVWENEPFVDRELLEMTDIATPHIAGYSMDGKANGTASCVRAASRYFGFGLDQWYPSDLPEPSQPILEIDAGGMTTEQVCRTAILKTYNVLEDDRRLRISPGQFENLRNNYPPRREFPAFTVRLKNANQDNHNILKEIGFRI